MIVRRSYKPKNASRGTMARLSRILVLSLKQKECQDSQNLQKGIAVCFVLKNIWLLQHCKATGKGFYVQSCYCTVFVQLLVRKEQILKGEKKKIKIQEKIEGCRRQKKLHSLQSVILKFLHPRAFADFMKVILLRHSN